MIETCQSISVAAPMGAVWDYVRDIRRWAQLMPGMQTCEVTDDDHSMWGIKVGVGGMVAGNQERRGARAGMAGLALGRFGHLPEFCITLKRLGKIIPNLLINPNILFI